MSFMVRLPRPPGIFIKPALEVPPGPTTVCEIETEKVNR